MKKLLLTTALALVISTPVYAKGLDDFRNNGQVGYYDIDFAMQGEVNNMNNNIEDKINGLSASMSAMAMMPSYHNAVSMGLGFSDDEQALAIGYSRNYNEKVMWKIGATADTDGGTSAGVGILWKLN